VAADDHLLHRTANAAGNVDFGRKGVIEVLEPDLSAHDRHAVDYSADAVMKVQVAR
jgi:hypothetical protein